MKSLIIVENNNKAQKLWSLINGKNYKLYVFKGFKDFTDDPYSKKTLGMSLDNKYEFLVDEDQKVIKKLKNSIYNYYPDVIYIGLSGLISDYTSFILSSILKNSFPTIKIKRIHLSGITKDRVIQSINKAESVFNESAYQKELTIKMMNRLSAYHITNKHKDINLQFPGIFAYYVLNFINNKNKGYYVKFSDKMSLFFKEENEAKAFIDSYTTDNIKIEKTKVSSDLVYTKNHFFKSKVLLKKYSMEDLMSKLWYMYDKGLITDPSHLTYLTEKEKRDIEKYYSDILDDKCTFRDTKGIFVTDINRKPKLVEEKLRYIYRYIWRLTLASTSSSFKGIKHEYYYNDIYLGCYESGNELGYKRFIHDFYEEHDLSYSGFKKKNPFIEKSKCTIYDIVSHFGMYSFYSLRSLIKQDLIYIDNNDIKVRENTTILVKLLLMLYPEILLSSNIKIIYESISKVKEDIDRIQTLNKFRINIDKGERTIDYPVCINCKKELVLSLGKNPLLVCNIDKEGCGALYKIKIQNNKFKPVILDKDIR